MTVRVLTSSLLGLLSDLIQTADRGPDPGVMGSVLLHTARGHIGGEPGKAELLVGASSDRTVAGHAYTSCAGDIAEPTLWSIRDATSVISVFKAAKGRDKFNTHAVEIRVVGGEVEIREDPNLIDEGVSLRFGEQDATDFPAATLYRILDNDRPTTVHLGGEFLDATPRTDIWHFAIEPFVKVGKRRGECLRIYRGHQRRPLLVQIGDHYRGLLMPYRPTEVYGDEQRPDADLYPPDLTRWAKPATTTVDVSKDGGETWQQLDLIEAPAPTDEGDEPDGR